MSEEKCEVCSRKISLKENPYGLVFRDEFFVCEKCVDKNPEKKISKLSKTTMQSPDNGMPIALWLVHEQNKDKTMMTVRNK
jgi:hypothetical protein